MVNAKCPFVKHEKGHIKWSMDEGSAMDLKIYSKTKPIGQQKEFQNNLSFLTCHRY